MPTGEPLARLLSLRVELRDEAAAAEVTPERFGEYLAERGWMHVASTASGTWGIWSRGDVLLTIPYETFSPDESEILYTSSSRPVYPGPAV